MTIFDHSYYHAHLLRKPDTLMFVCLFTANGLQIKFVSQSFSKEMMFQKFLKSQFLVPSSYRRVVALQKLISSLWERITKCTYSICGYMYRKQKNTM